MDFITFLEREFQEKVAKGYIKDFKQYLGFLEKRNQQPTKIKKSDIIEYIMWLREIGTKETTINKKISLIRKYYRFLRIHNVMLENPLEEIKQLKIYKESKEVSEEDKQKLINKVDNKRDELILKLLIIEKVKPKDIIELTFQNVDSKKEILYVGNKAIILSEETLALLKEMEGPPEQFLVRNQHGKQIKESGIYFILNKHLKGSNVGVKPNYFLKGTK